MRFLKCIITIGLPSLGGDIILKVKGKIMLLILLYGRKCSLFRLSYAEQTNYNQNGCATKTKSKLSYTLLETSLLNVILDHDTPIPISQNKGYLFAPKEQ